MSNQENNSVSSNFIKQIIDEDLRTGKNGNKVHTRFPPEPNGYLHIGHAKSICLNFGIAKDYNGKCNLRFDDTNPSKEEQEYVDSIKEDIKWLGFDWEEREFYASDYFETLYEFAIKLIKKEKAYVCDLTGEEIRKYRGTLTEPGIESPYRNRSIEDNLVLFEKMRNGEFKDGEKTLRAKIDMASPNINLRDPVMYRILKVSHHRTGDKWCIYPTYDWAHGQSDQIEGITHSICTLEFENHKPLYNWFLQELELPNPPQQIEFARLNLTYTVMSKRRLLQLVEEKHVEGWDDPRMPTLAGMRRRGFTPEAIRNFAETIGVAKRDNVIDVGLLEFSVRDHLNKIAPRIFAVFKPLKVVIINYPEGQIEELEAIINPEDPNSGKRKIPFSKEIYIDSDDFMENPPDKYFRLKPGGEVRLKYAYIIKCEEVIKNSAGEIVEIRCTYDVDTKSGTGTSNKKVKGTIHWVPVNESIKVTVRLYDRLFNVENPGGDNFLNEINNNSLEVIENCLVEPSIGIPEKGSKWQFERLGYFTVDSKLTTEEKIVFNRTVTLKDTWAKIQKQKS